MTRKEIVEAVAGNALKVLAVAAIVFGFFLYQGEIEAARTIWFGMLGFCIGVLVLPVTLRIRGE